MPHMTPQLDAIVRALAAADEPIDTSYGVCLVCPGGRWPSGGGGPPTAGETRSVTGWIHGPDCPWVMARAQMEMESHLSELMPGDGSGTALPPMEDLSDCAYYQGGTGTCSYGGCRDEPDCITKRPVGGWPSEVPRIGTFWDDGTLDVVAALDSPAMDCTITPIVYKLEMGGGVPRLFPVVTPPPYPEDA